VGSFFFGGGGVIFVVIVVVFSLFFCWLSLAYSYVISFHDCRQHALFEGLSHPESVSFVLKNYDYPRHFSDRAESFSPVAVSVNQLKTSPAPG